MHLPEDLERSVLAQVRSGLFSSVDELCRSGGAILPAAAECPLCRSWPGFYRGIRDAADELDETVADAMKHRREETWREIFVQ